MPQFHKIHFVINPAAGQPKPILHTLNSVLHSHDVDWDLSITRVDGDGKRLAQQAVENGADLIVACGGDGTVKDVANGLLDSHVPMALLHGGTGNAMAYELGIPPQLEQATELLVSENQLQSVDLGQVTCDDDSENVGYFMLRMSMGLQTKILETANRELKTRFGNLAYLVASLQELRESNSIPCHFTIDGKDIEGSGLTTLIANSAFVGGQANFSFAPTVDPSDGLLDVMVMDNSFVSTLNMISNALQIGEADHEQHWRGKEIIVHEPKEQLITLDGEIFGHTPAKVKIIHDAIQVVVPIKSEQTEKGEEN